jgi:hypothetical protein
MTKRPLKASEVFAGEERFLGTTTDWREAFPRIESVRVEVTTRYNSTRRKVLLRPREFSDCTNQRCYKGGFPLGQVLRNMEYSRKPEEESTKVPRRGGAGTVRATTGSP